MRLPPNRQDEPGCLAWLHIAVVHSLVARHETGPTADLGGYTLVSDGSATTSGTDWRAVARRGWVFLLLGVIVGAGAGYLYAKSQKMTWQATASVLVQATGVPTASVANSRTSSEVNLDTEAKLVTSTRVLTLAHGSLKLNGDPGVLAPKIAVTVPPNSQLLTITFTADSAAGARDGANAVASAYLVDRTATARSTINNAANQLSANLTGYQTSLNVLNTQIAALTPGDSKLAPAQSRRNNLQGQIRDVTGQLTNLRNIVVTPGSVSSTASLPTAPSGPSKTLDVASGAALGLVAGITVAWLWTRKVRRIRRPADVAVGIGLPVVGRIDGLRVGEHVDAEDARAQDYRRLANVVSASLPPSGGIIVVAGCDDSAAASTVSTNLAATLLSAGETVNILRAGVHEDIDTEGPVEVIDGIGSDTKKLLPTAGPRTRRALAQLRQDGGYVLADVPDPLATADGQALGASADAVLLIVRNHAKVEHISAVLAQFDAVSAPILGAVLITMDRAQPMQRASLSKAAALSDERGSVTSGSSRRTFRTTDGEPAEKNGATPSADSEFATPAPAMGPLRGSAARTPRRRLRPRSTPDREADDRATSDDGEANRAVPKYAGRDDGNATAADESDRGGAHAAGTAASNADRRGTARSHSRIRLR